MQWLKLNFRFLTHFRAYIFRNYLIKQCCRLKFRPATSNLKKPNFQVYIDTVIMFLSLLFAEISSNDHRLTTFLHSIIAKEFSGANKEGGPKIIFIMLKISKWRYGGNHSNIHPLKILSFSLHQWLFSAKRKKPSHIIV